MHGPTIVVKLNKQYDLNFYRTIYTLVFYELISVIILKVLN